MIKTIAEAVEALNTTKHDTVISNLYEQGLFFGSGAYSDCFYFPKENKILKITFNDIQNEIATYNTMKGYDFIPKLYEYGDGYLVTEYIEGLTLQEKIYKEGFDFSNEPFWNQLLLILGEFEKKGIEVSDIHDENIIITPFNKVYLIDFGAYTPLMCRSEINVPDFIMDWKDDYSILEGKIEYLENQGYFIS